MVLSTMPPLGNEPANLTAGQAWLHLGWLAALVTVTALVAMARTRPDSSEPADTGRG